MGSWAFMEWRQLWSGGWHIDHHFRHRAFLRPAPGADCASTQPAGSLPRRARLAPRRSSAIAILALVSTFGTFSLRAGDKLSFDERIELERGLMAEIAIAKILLPRSAKPLIYSSDGH